MKAKMFKRSFFLILTLVSTINATAWVDHTLLTYPALRKHAVWAKLSAVEARELTNFLMANEAALENFLAMQEEWSVQNLPNYRPRPENLAFKATGNIHDVKQRFFRAIRINPDSYASLYLHLIPGQAFDTANFADPHRISTSDEEIIMSFTRFAWISNGSLVMPLDVLATATDEMDYGYDLGLFEDNNTYYGAENNFGKQTFGNPNLNISSQAPFHMSFYHEAGIVMKFAPFLKATYVDYRLNLYRMLSTFAFEHGEAYWGWRFMGWSMHYLGDQTMPYHCAPLPGMSVWKMLWINLKAILGWEKAKNNAVQLVSNKHMVMERYAWETLRKAYLEGNLQHPYFQALENPYPPQSYNDRFVYDVLSAQSVKMAKNCHRTMLECFPEKMVADPSVEAMDMVEMNDTPAAILQKSGQEGIRKMDEMLAERFRAYSFAMNAMLEYMLPAAQSSIRPQSIEN